MRFDIMTLFPEMVMNGHRTSIIGRAAQKGILEIEAWNIRDYAFNKHHSVDDYPYGGGAGMLMQAEPVYQTYKAICEKTGKEEGKRPRVVYLSPQGKTFNQSMAEEFAREDLASEKVFEIDVNETFPERSIILIHDTEYPQSIASKAFQKFLTDRK